MTTIPPTLRVIIILFVYLLYVGLTLGFEQMTYMFSEPNPGTSQLVEEVCVVISDGSVGRDFAVNVMWTPDTATGERVEMKLS